MQHLVLCVFLGLLPFVASQTTTQETALLFEDRYTFLSDRRAPDCNGPEENGCNCANSEYRCRHPDRAALCPNNAEGGCVTTVEGQPICAIGGGKKCSSSSECADGGSVHLCGTHFRNPLSGFVGRSKGLCDTHY